MGDLASIHIIWFETRFDALELIHKHLGPLSAGVAKSLVLRHDHGSHEPSLQRGASVPEFKSNPSFVGSLEGNMAAGQFIRAALNEEQLLWARTLEVVEELLCRRRSSSRRDTTSTSCFSDGCAILAKAHAAYEPVTATA